jgi:hypothetical protein
MSLRVRGCGTFLISGVVLALTSLSLSTNARPASGDTVRALSVVRIPTPSLKVPYYRTRGTYLRVFTPGLSLETVNRSLLNALESYQLQYGRAARQYEAHLPKQLMRTYPGRFETFVKPGLLSASTVVVSALIPLLELVPGGNDGNVWFSITVDASSGKAVAMQSLFSRPGDALRAVARLARRQVLASNRCISQFPVLMGFSPTWQNYRTFALTQRGLAIGFPNGQLGPALCDRISTIVPYPPLAPYLSGLGRRLMAGVREAKAA